MLSELPDTTGTVLRPLQYQCLGLRLVPLRGKRPLVKKWQHLHLGRDEILHWDCQRVNWGAITGDPLIVLDTDTEEAEAWVRAKGIESPVMVRSGGGGTHRYFLKPDTVTVIRNRKRHARYQRLGCEGLARVHCLTGRDPPRDG